MAAIVVLPATAASAHVTIEPPSAPKGTDAVISFVVPNEMENANTTQVQVVFPTDHLIPDASTQPVAGWTPRSQMAHSDKPLQTDHGTTNDYVQSITWSGGSIPPGQFQEFAIALGLPDDASSLTFKALQTYSNGQIVRWIETRGAGQPEPENPAPVLQLTSANGDTSAATTTTTVRRNQHREPGRREYGEDARHRRHDHRRTGAARRDPVRDPFRGSAHKARRENRA